MLLLFGVARPGGCVASGCHAQRMRWKKGRVVVVARRGRERPLDCSGNTGEEGGESRCSKGATEGEKRKPERGFAASGLREVRTLGLVVAQRRSR